MREPRFIKKNKQKWDSLENLMKSGERDPDLLKYHFIEITDDLAYSKTYYPNSGITQYLNQLAGSLHQIIYRQSWQEEGYLKKFWKTELPLLFFEARKEIITSFVLLFIAVAIGVVSGLNDNHFIRLILGDSYVNMTIENVRQGDPMAVYKKMNQMDMFLGITLNNVRVSILTFAAGILFAFGTAYIIFSNGIMIGAFMTFCYTQGVINDALLTVWVHGTLEIASIAVAGGAGFLLGKGFLFPKSYSRIYSFVLHAKKATKILLGIIPLIVTAAFIESFFTRYTEWESVFKLFFSVGSLVFVVYYFFIYPARLARNGNQEK